MRFGDTAVLSTTIPPPASIYPYRSKTDPENAPTNLPPPPLALRVVPPQPDLAPVGFSDNSRMTAFVCPGEERSLPNVVLKALNEVAVEEMVVEVEGGRAGGVTVVTSVNENMREVTISASVDPSAAVGDLVVKTVTIKYVHACGHMGGSGGVPPTAPERSHIRRGRTHLLCARLLLPQK